MSDAIAAHAAFSKLLTKCISFAGDYIKVVAAGLGKSAQTVRQYKAAPGSKSHRVPTAEVIEELREFVMHNLRRYKMYVPEGAVAYRVDGAPNKLQFADYLVALDYADRYNGVVKADGGEIPKLDNRARQRHEWRQIAFGGVVPVEVLASIAGVDVYTVGWVGREHPECGIQPTWEMVYAALAAEALEDLRRHAA